MFRPVASILLLSLIAGAAAASSPAVEKLEIEGWSTASDRRPLAEGATIHVRAAVAAKSPRTLESELIERLEEILSDRGFVPAASDSADYELVFAYGSRSILEKDSPPFLHGFDVVVVNPRRVPRGFQASLEWQNLPLVSMSQVFRKWELKCLSWKGHAHALEASSDLDLATQEDVEQVLHMLVDVAMRGFGETVDKWTIGAGWRLAPGQAAEP